MTLLFENETQDPFSFDAQETARQVILEALTYERFPFDAQVSLTLTGLEEIGKLNQEFRQIGSPTDVLSFPMIDYSAPGDFSELEERKDIFDPENGEVLLGDIVICVPKVVEQAALYGHSQRREYAFLIAHSMLHLMGYDHMDEADAAEMERRQEDILKRLSIVRSREEL